MTEKNILVFPAGTEIAFELHDALCRSKFVRLFGATSVPCHAELVFEHCAEDVPFPDQPGFLEKINEVVDQWQIDCIYPAHDSALLALARLRDQLHAELIASPLETVEVCRDKDKTYAFLAGAPYLAASWPDADAVPAYPVFLKPAVGQGAQGARRIDSREQLDEALADGRHYVLCEYLPGAEFTVDCFTDRHGRLRLVSPRSRDRIRAGIAVRSRLLPPDPEISAIAEDLNSRLVFRGAWFFQVKRDRAGSCRLMEAAPRVAGTMGATRAHGANLPLLTLFDRWGYDVDILLNDNEQLLDRAFISRFQTDLRYDRVYVDFDDTLILRGKVNGELMRFLYQARDAGKELILLSRHSRDLQEDLERYAISPALFSKILRLEEGDEKTRYISGPDAIFIDDSFAERRRVKDRCGIPVFDVDMVECLLDWRS
ncbi:MAG: ATP-grasp domain-containing protein [Oscillospiraceae bacterium]|nr:ATP-grasp domain-containing protein [Oscillospiraceae bacterium]